MTTRKFRIKIDGKIFEAEVEETSEAEVDKPVVKTKETPSPQIPTPSKEEGKSVVAPMPGKVIKINVSKGQKIKKGDVVLVIEAMKMEQEINSSLEGTVTDIQVSEGDMVKKEQVLIVIG
jgi:biotin carboxyl carrier protein